MNITYLQHSCFCVELSSCILLFDYTEGMMPVLPQDKPMYIFVSHHHDDHYDETIFKLRKQYHTTYIISDDVAIQKQNDIFFMKPYQRMVIDELVVETFCSTDEGVAFLIEAEGIQLYHAGDLHWWHWEEENTKEENAIAKELFLHEMKLLEDRAITIAFLPLEVRQKEQFYWGFHTFMSHHEETIAFPMHMWNHYEIIGTLKQLKCSEGYRTRIMSINRENQQFPMEVS